MVSENSDSIIARLDDHSLADGKHDQLRALVAAREQAGPLLQIVTDIGSDLDLQATLQRILNAAVQLTGASFGALGVRAADGNLVSLLEAGKEADPDSQMHSEALFGLLVDRLVPLRVGDVSSYAAEAGLSRRHPSWRAFLGIPIVIRGENCGSLYLTDDRPEFSFSATDEVGIQALASAAAVAVDNARLFDGLQDLARWTDASREITTVLLMDGRSAVRPLQLIAERARDLTFAEQAIVLVPADPDRLAEEVDSLTIATAAGPHADEIVGRQVPVVESTTGQVFRTGRATMTDNFRYPIESFTDQGKRPAIAVPLRASDEVIGVIAVARGVSQEPFDHRQLALVEDFAHHAALALTLAKANEQARKLNVLAERERIARDLHDHVIQRLFLSGMDLQGTIGRTRSPAIVDRLTRTVDDLQSIVDEIRTVVFELQSPAATAMNFRRRIQAAVASLTDNSHLATTLRLTGPMVTVDSALADHAEAVITEAISNTVRHSGATCLTVEVVVSDQLCIDVIDNGRGIPADNQRQSGLANLRSRAQWAGGACRISSSPDAGTHVHWKAPLAPV